MQRTVLQVSLIFSGLISDMYYPPEKINMIQVKRDHFLKGISSSKHRFSGDMLGFRGVDQANYTPKSLTTGG